MQANKEGNVLIIIIQENRISIYRSGLVLREIVITKCIDRVQHVLNAGSAYSAGRWIYQQLSLCRLQS
jgi:hypothetical protein